MPDHLQVEASLRKAITDLWRRRDLTPLEMQKLRSLERNLRALWLSWPEAAGGD